MLVHEAKYFTSIASGKFRPADVINTKLLHFIGFLIGWKFNIPLHEYYRIVFIAV
jgi:hypothetical protein